MLSYVAITVAGADSVAGTQALAHGYSMALAVGAGLLVAGGAIAVVVMPLPVRPAGSRPVAIHADLRIYCWDGCRS
jgi:hypothetical protein